MSPHLLNPLIPIEQTFIYYTEINEKKLIHRNCYFCTLIWRNLASISTLLRFVQYLSHTGV